MRSSRSGPDPLDPGPRGFAHRGLYGAGVPENSLAAFSAAIAFGAGIECDVRLSGSGSAIVFHDRDLRRVCDVALDVETTPTALLTDQRLTDTDQHLPALHEVLDLVDGRVPLLLELKTCGGNAAQLCREVTLDIGAALGSIGVMSFDPQVGLWLRRYAPTVPRGLVIGDDLPSLKRWFAMLITTPQFLAVDHKAFGRRWVARHWRWMRVYAWTIRSAAERAQAEVQADSLIWEADGRPRN